MNFPPLFSIVIPCYNAQHTLRETVASVIAQSLSDWELIVVDDGSSDSSLDLIAELAANDSRILVVNLAHRGVSAARNEGVRLTRGHYLAFLDADDLWHPDKLARHAEHLAKHSEVGVSFARVQFMSPSGEPSPQFSAVPPEGLSAFSLLTENHVSTSSNIVARREVFEALGGFQEGMSFAEDQEWLLRVAAHGRWRLAGIDDALVYYRTSTGSLSSSLERMEHGWLDLLDKATCYAPEFVARHRVQAHAVYLRYLARRALRQGEPAAVGLNYLRRAWRISASALLRQPRRSLLTLAGLLVWRYAPRLADRAFLQLSRSPKPPLPSRELGRGR